MINEKEYIALLEYAGQLVEGGVISALDIVHDAIAANPEASRQDVRDAYYREKRRQNTIVELSEIPVSRVRGTIMICIGCREPLPLGAFYQRTDGRLRTRCRACQAEYLRVWRNRNKKPESRKEKIKRKIPSEYIKEKNRIYSQRYREKKRKEAGENTPAKPPVNLTVAQRWRKHYWELNRERINESRKKKYKEKKQQLAADASTSLRCSL